MSQPQTQSAPPPAATPPSLGWPARLAIVGAGFVVAFIPFGQYLNTLAPTVLGDDPGEMQVLAWALGIPHTTGYPLYIWLGKIFTLLPFGDVAYRVNLMSAFFAAASAFMVYLLVGTAWSDRGWTRWAAGGAAGLALGYTHTVWSQAIIAAAYTLHIFLALTVFWLAYLWSRKQKDWLLGAGAFTWGAMFGNHLSALALGPGLLLFFFLHRSAWSKRRLLVAGGGLLLGLLIGNLLLFWLLWRRHLPFDHWHGVMATSLDLFGIPAEKGRSFFFAWWFTVSGGQFREPMFAAPETWSVLQRNLIPHRVLSEFFPVGAVLAAAGWFLLWRRWRLNILLTAVFLAQCWINLNYYVPWKVHIYYITPLAITAVWIGAALALPGSLLEWIAGKLRRWDPDWKLVTVALLLFGSFWGLHRWNQAERAGYERWLVDRRPELFRREVLPALGRRPDMSNHLRDQRRARAIVEALPDNAILFTTWEIQYAVEYVARVEKGIRTLTVLEAHPYAGTRSGTFSKYRWDLIRENKETRPIYFTYFPQRDVALVYQLAPAGAGLWVLRP
jgi:hypothetical protein